MLAYAQNLLRSIVFAFAIALPNITFAQDAASGITPSDAIEATYDSYELTIRNIQVGTLKFKNNSGGSGYMVDATFETKGLAGAIFNTKITGKSILNAGFQPQKAKIEISRHAKKSTHEMTFENGLISNLITNPLIPTKLDPNQYNGALDPLSALAYIFRPVQLNNLCKTNVRIFDGITANRVTMSHASQRPDGRYQCQGGFTRESGYSAELLDEQGASFIFTALYRVDRISGVVIIDRIVGESPYGQFQLLHTF